MDTGIRLLNEFIAGSTPAEGIKECEMSTEEEKDQVFTAAGAFFIGIVGLFFFTSLFALPFMYVWNNVCVEVLTFCKEISYWQSIGMLFFIFFIGRIINFTNTKI